MELTTEQEQAVRHQLESIKSELNASFDINNILAKILDLIVYLQSSEKLLIIAIERSQEVPPTFIAPKSGRAEFGWLPYLFKHASDTGTSDPLVKELQAVLKVVFGQYASILEKILHVFGLLIIPQITQEQWNYLEDNLGSHNIIAGDGTIVGDSLYEDMDKGWLYAPANYLFNLTFPGDIANFNPPAPAIAYNGPIGGGADSIKIAIIGDWGTGNFEASQGYDPASWVLQAVKNLKPDYVIHLGDVYYAGTELRYPPGEEAENFLDLWPNSFNGKSFTLNSNHEMYGGAQGYFNIALNRNDTAASPFCTQNGFSYFALEFGNWVLVGFDAAYNDTSALYMQGGIGTEATLPNDPQLAFLKDVARQYANKQIILFSHQTGMSTDGTTINDATSGEPLFPLLSQLQATGLTPDYWYWGHIHLGIAYGDQSAVTTTTDGKTKARCIGHSAIPIGAPWGLNVDGNVIDFIADTPIPETALVLNGLAMITLTTDGGITEQFFDGVEQGSDLSPLATWQENNS